MSQNSLGEHVWTTDRSADQQGPPSDSLEPPVPGARQQRCREAHSWQAGAQSEPSSASGPNGHMSHTKDGDTACGERLKGARPSSGRLDCRYCDRPENSGPSPALSWASPHQKEHHGKDIQENPFCQETMGQWLLFAPAVSSASWGSSRKVAAEVWEPRVCVVEPPDSNASLQTPSDGCWDRPSLKEHVFEGSRQ